MSFRTRPYKTAILAQRIEGIVNYPGEANHGKRARIEVWGGTASDGYKTDYTHRSVAWIVVKVDGQKTWCRRFSGKRLLTVETEIDNIRSILVPAPQPVPAEA